MHSKDYGILTITANSNISKTRFYFILRTVGVTICNKINIFATLLIPKNVSSPTLTLLRTIKSSDS